MEEINDASHVRAVTPSAITMHHTVQDRLTERPLGMNIIDLSQHSPEEIID